MAGRNSEVRVAIVADNSNLNRTLDQSQGKLASFGKAVGKIAFAAGAAAVVGLGALAKASVDAASLAQQSLGGTQAVFGKYADAVISDSKRAANQFGLSANDYRESANIIGALLVNQGLAQDKLRGSTKGLITTASDLAATYGGTTKNAVDALSSALKGEFDPLQNLGITLLQSKVNTEAYRITNSKTAAEFAKLSTASQTAAKRQATLNLITKQAKVAQGQFGKQSQTLAEQQQILGAQWDNLKVKIGNALIPVVTQLFVVLNTQVMPALRRLAKRYLPEVRQALTKWLRSGDPAQMMRDLGKALRDIDWGKVSTGLGSIGASLKEAAPQLKAAAASGIGDSFTVLGVAVKVAADHVDILAKAMPVLVSGFVLFKGAQLLNNLAGKDSVVGLVAQLYATRQLKAAVDQLAASTGNLTAHTAEQALASEEAAATTSKLGTAAKGAAGLAGMALLAHSTQQTSKSMGILEGAAGGALTGFAVGGPWGAAIGAGVGALTGLITSTHDAGDAADDMGAQWATLAGTLDDTTGAITAMTRATVYQNLKTSGTLDSLAKLGVANRTVVSYVLGHARAQAQLTAVLNSQQAGVDKLNGRIAGYQATIDQLSPVLDSASDAQRRQYAEAVRQVPLLTELRDRRQADLDSIRREVAELGAERAAKLAQIRATEDLSSLYGKLPKRVVTKLDAEGIDPSVRGIARVANRFHLLPKKVQPIIDALGIDTTIKKVQRVRDNLRKTAKTKANLGPFKQSIDSQLARFGFDASTGAKTIAGNIKRETGKAKADLSPFQRALRQSLSGAKSTATTGGQGVGDSLKTGVLTGVGGLDTALSNSVASAVNAAIAAGRAAADAHSPSRKMHTLGQDMAHGLVLGLGSMDRQLVKAGAGMVDAAAGAASSRVRQVAGTTVPVVSSSTADSGALAVAVPAPTPLKPREVPVKVYLDGAEIADRLSLRANRLATATLTRRP